VIRVSVSGFCFEFLFRGEGFIFGIGFKSRVSGFGFRLQDSSLGFRVSGVEFQVSFSVSGFGVRGSGPGNDHPEKSSSFLQLMPSSVSLVMSA